MTHGMANFHEVTTLTEADANLAGESSQQLAKLLSTHLDRNQRSDFKLLVHQANGDSDETIVIPRSALYLLTDILRQMACSNTVALTSVQAELTTQQAADMLNVSRPFLVDLLDSNRIPSRKVGTHRRVRFDDLMAYKQAIDGKRLESLDELACEAQALDMGY